MFKEYFYIYHKFMMDDGKILTVFVVGLFSNLEELKLNSLFMLKTVWHR